MMSLENLSIDGASLEMTSLWRISQRGFRNYELSGDANQKMLLSRRYIESEMQKGRVMYGVNTGFGAFSSVRISDAETDELQRNLIRSHSVGVGPLFTRAQTRAIMALRANALATGFSGIRPAVVEKILEFLSHDVLPAIPSKGSVGASGDLAPLSHLALALIGEGSCLAEDGKVLPTKKILQEKGILPLELKAKEGLSVINGCQVMTAVGLLALYRARRLLKLFDLAACLSLEALKGSRRAFDPRISAVRKHPGEAKTARNLLKILQSTSEIARSHQGCDKVQDAYSLRCVPAVHGAAKDALERATATLEIEANSSTDNPLVFVDGDRGDIISCGNFHGEPVALQLDFAGIAVAELGSISECRIEKMINPAMSGLPAFLAPKGGLNSGHMITHVVAASLVSENKVLCHPASVDSIPTSADKEDHVSMGTIAARKLDSIVENVETICAIEVLVAAQGIDFLRPLKSSSALEAVHARVRERVPFAQTDRVFSDDINAIRELILDDQFLLDCGLAGLES